MNHAKASQGVEFFGVRKSTLLSKGASFNDALCSVRNETNRIGDI